MNLTPANWKKSEVTENKQFVTVGMKLYATHASDKGIVIERDGDNILFQSDDDLNGEWNEWFNLNDLQLGWHFSNKDREFIEAVKNH